MQLRYYMSDRLLPGLLPSMLLWLCIPCYAGPALVTAISTTSSEVRLSVSAQGLPQFKLLTLTFAYDPLAVDPLSAIASCPLTGAGLSAWRDTSAKTFVLHIVANSTITIADGARVSTISASLLQSGAAENALRLADALCIDKDNAPIVLSISNQTAAVRSIFKNAPPSAAGRPQLPGKVSMLDGRKYTTGRHGAVFVGVGRDGVKLFLMPLRIYSK